MFTSKKFPQLLSVIAFGLVVMLSGLNMFASAKLSNQGEQLRSTELQIRQLAHQNQLLEQKLINARSLTSLSQTAASLGFTHQPETLILKPEGTVAALNQDALLY